MRHKDKEPEVRWLISNGFTKPDLKRYFNMSEGWITHLLSLWGLKAKPAPRGCPKGTIRGPRPPKDLESRWQSLLHGREF